MKTIITSILLLLFLSTPAYSVSEPDVMNMYMSLVGQWKEQISIAFDKAEKEVYPNYVPDGPIPDEDAAKCPCKGTGVIVHGDGHKTECPFHSNKMEASLEELPPLVKIQKLTCQCETRCACDECECLKTETELVLQRTEIK